MRAGAHQEAVNCGEWFVARDDGGLDTRQPFGAAGGGHVAGHAIQEGLQVGQAHWAHVNRVRRANGRQQHAYHARS